MSILSFSKAGFKTRSLEEKVNVGEQGARRRVASSQFEERSKKTDNVEPQRLVVKKSGFYLEYNEK